MFETTPFRTRQMLVNLVQDCRDARASVVVGGGSGGSAAFVADACKQNFAKTCLVLLFECMIAPLFAPFFFLVIVTSNRRRRPYKVD